MTRRIPFVLLLMVVAAVLAQGQGTNRNQSDDEAIKNEILKLEDAQHEAFVKGDAEIIDRIYADDASLTYADGKIISKAQLLADIRSGKHRLYQVTHDDLQIHIYGDTVVVTGHSTATGTMYNRARRLTNVYVKQNGQWILVAHHVSYVEEK